MLEAFRSQQRSRRRRFIRSICASHGDVKKGGDCESYAGLMIASCGCRAVVSTVGSFEGESFGSSNSSFNDVEDSYMSAEWFKRNYS